MKYFLVPILFLLFIENTSAQMARPKPDRNVRALIVALQKKSSPALDYLAATLKTYPFVALGTDIFVKEHLEFLSASLPVIFENQTELLIFEMLSSENQPKIDKYIESKTEDEGLLKDILATGIEPAGFGYKEYAGLFRQIRILSAKLPLASRRLRVLFAAKPIDWQSVFDNKEKINEYHRNRAKFIADLIEKESFNQNKKAIYFGSYDQTLTNFGKSAINLLVERGHRGSIFSIYLNSIDRDPRSKKKYPICKGIIDRLAKQAKIKPFGIDLVGTPLGLLKNCYSNDPIFTPLNKTKWPLMHGWNGLIYLLAPGQFHCVTPEPGYFADDQTLQGIVERNKLFCTP